MRVWPMRCVPRKVPSPYRSRHACRVAEILDQLECAAEGENLGALDLLDLVGELAGVAGVAEPIAKGIRGRLCGLDGLGAESASRSSTSAGAA